jgi:hypothetical protein
MGGFHREQCNVFGDRSIYCAIGMGAMSWRLQNLGGAGRSNTLGEHTGGGTRPMLPPKQWRVMKPDCPSGPRKHAYGSPRRGHTRDVDQKPSTL